jgi:hypothetical protein
MDGLIVFRRNMLLPPGEQLKDSSLLFKRELASSLEMDLALIVGKILGSLAYHLFSLHLRILVLALIRFWLLI